MDNKLSAILIKALNETKSPVTVTDALVGDDIIIYCNKAFVELSGYKYDEIIGKNCRFLQGKDTDKKSVTEIARALRENENIDITILNYCKNGDSFWNDLNITPVVNDEGITTHHFGFQNNITMRLEKEKLSNLVKEIEANVILEDSYIKQINFLREKIKSSTKIIDSNNSDVGDDTTKLLNIKSILEAEHK